MFIALASLYIFFDRYVVYILGSVSKEMLLVNSPFVSPEVIFSFAFFYSIIMKNSSVLIDDLDRVNKIIGIVDSVYSCDVGSSWR